MDWKSYDIWVPGEPVPLSRPRFGKGHIYLPEKSAKYKKNIQTIAKATMAELGLDGNFSGAIEIDLVFNLPIPKSWTKKKQNEAKKGNIHHTTRPDLDNLTKAVLDGLIKVVFADDAQIYLIHAVKQYSINDELGVRITIWEKR